MKAGSRNSWKEQKGAWLEKAGREEVEVSGLRKQARESRQFIQAVRVAQAAVRSLKTAGHWYKG